MLHSKINVRYAFIYWIAILVYFIVFHLIEFQSLLKPFIAGFPLCLLLFSAWKPMLSFPGGKFLLIGVFFNASKDVVHSLFFQDSYLLELLLFFCANICYIISFLYIFNYKFFYLLPVTLSASVIICLTYYFHIDIYEMKLPVQVYFTVLFFVAFFGTFRNSNYFAVIIGTIFLLFYGFVFGLNEDIYKNFFGFPVVLLYYVSQFLIVFGCISDSEIRRILIDAKVN